jgi:peroxiredoxin
MKSITATLVGLSASAVRSLEAELARKRLQFDVLHDRAKRTSRYTVTYRNASELPALLRAKVEVR